MLSGEPRSQTLTRESPQLAAPNALAEVAQLPATEVTQILGEKALTAAAPLSTEIAPATPPAAPSSELPKAALPKPQAEEAPYEHPLMTPRPSSLTPQERVNAAMRRYGSDDESANAQNRLDMRHRRTQRVKDGYEPYSVVTALLDGYTPDFHRY